jgi:hypothetical protein
MATGAARRLAVVAEATYGAGAPATPVFDTLLVRSGGPKLDMDTLEDDTIRSDFQRTGVRTGVRKGSFALSTWMRYGAYDNYLQALLGGTWTTNVLKTGTTRRSFVMEEFYGDLNNSDKPYHRYSGVEFSKFAMSVANNQLVSASFDGLCKDMARDTVIVTGATYGALSTQEAMAFKDAAFTVGGSSIGIVTSMSLAIDRQLQQRFTANGVTTLQPDSRVVKVNGTLEVWLDTGTGALIDAFMSETEKALALTLTDPTNDVLSFVIPALKFTSGMPDVKGDTSVPVSLNFEAYFDAVSSSQLTITRTPHA